MQCQCFLQFWSNPGNGLDVVSILPAVPSPSGVADVFAVQGYYIPQPTIVQAITSDGITAWTASLASLATVVPVCGRLKWRIAIAAKSHYWVSPRSMIKRIAASIPPQYFTALSRCFP